VAQGVRYIQLDAPFYSHYLDPQHREATRQSGGNPDAEFEAAVAGDNASVAGLSRTGVTLAVHVCRGNSRSRWYSEGGYDAIAEKLFARLDVDRFLLEYDTERSGSFEPLRLVPRGKDVVLGLVATGAGSRARRRSAPADRRGRAIRRSTSRSARSAASRRRRRKSPVDGRSVAQCTISSSQPRGRLGRPRLNVPPATLSRGDVEGRGHTRLRHRTARCR
jgi:5-methyltetrahydropteroyltriglutamate--homocysteine methyltransferase